MDNTQINDIANHLMNGKGISQRDADDLYGATRLSAIVFVLRHKRGMNIESVTRKGKTRHNRPCTYTEYFLREGDK